MDIVPEKAEKLNNYESPIKDEYIEKFLREAKKGTRKLSLKEYLLRMINAIDSPVRHVFIRDSIADKTLVDEVFATYRPSVVVNLAAQAGVRYSIDHPDVYIESNLIVFLQYFGSLPPLL